MYSYALLDHTADVRLQVTATTLEELFQGAVLGMATLLHSENKENITISCDISIESSSITSLLIDFLSEVLTLSHIHGALFTKITQMTLTENSIAATIGATKVEYFEKDVKAVTYHEADIVKIDPNTLQTIIVFDI